MNARPLSRRRFLGTTVAASAALLASESIDAVLARLARGAAPEAAGFGPLVQDANGVLDLPAGFEYRALSTAWLGAATDKRFGQKLSGGDPVPPLHDGMGSFAGKRGVTILVRNHEIDLKNDGMVDPGRIRAYDPLGKGGTTTLWVDRERTLVRSFASLSGTVRNCAGGITPWDSWLTAEECVYLAGPKDAVNHDLTPSVSQRHGYVFEVDAHAESLVEPVPLVAMGRFYHEAVAVDPESAFAYLTEDRADGLFYRFRPDVLAVGVRTPVDMRVGDLAKGGVLEALRIVGKEAALTQNWPTNDARAFAVGERYKVDWVTIPNVDPDMDQERDPEDHEADPLDRKPRTAATSTRAQGFALGAAQFARTEGILYDRGAVFFCCTNGGRAKAGQVWKLDLKRQELELVVEPNDKALLEGPDNLCVAPFGDLIVCEDHPGTDRVIGITPQGRTYVLARNAISDEEFAGACFSADGRTLFVNMRNPGITFAIWGPWGKRRA